MDEATDENACANASSACADAGADKTRATLDRADDGNGGDSDDCEWDAFTLHEIALMLMRDAERSKAFESSPHRRGFKCAHVAPGFDLAEADARAHELVCISDACSDSDEHSRDAFGRDAERARSIGTALHASAGFAGMFATFVRVRDALACRSVHDYEPWRRADVASLERCWADVGGWAKRRKIFQDVPIVLEKKHHI